MKKKSPEQYAKKEVVAVNKAPVKKGPEFGIATLLLDWVKTEAVPLSRALFIGLRIATNQSNDGHPIPFDRVEWIPTPSDNKMIAKLLDDMNKPNANKVRVFETFLKEHWVRKPALAAQKSSVQKKPSAKVRNKTKVTVMYKKSKLG